MQKPMCSLSIVSFFLVGLLASVAPSSAAEPKPLKTLRTTTGAARALTFAPDGKSLAAVEHGRPPPGPKGPGGARTAVIGGFGPGGFDSVQGGLHDRIIVWDLTKSTKPTTFNSVPPEDFGALKFGEFNAMVPAGVMNHLDDNTLVASTFSGRIRVWDRTTGKVRATLEGHAREGGRVAYVDSMAVSPNGKLIASNSSADERLRVWDVATGKILWHAVAVNSVTFSPDGEKIVGTAGDHIEVFDTKGQSKKYSHESALDLGLIAFLPDGTTLRTLEGWESGTIRDWDCSTGKPIRTLKKNQILREARTEPSKALFSPDASLLLVIRPNKPFALYDAATGDAIAQFGKVKNTAVDATFSRDSKRLATTTSDENFVKIWDVEALRKAPQKQAASKNQPSAPKSSKPRDK